MTEPSVYDMTYCALDFETTGLNPHWAEVVEVGAVRFNLLDDCRATFTQLVKPKAKIPKAATEVHGITNEMVEKMPSIDQVMPTLEAFIGNAVVVAHNAKHDLRFVGEDVRKNKAVDTLRLSRNNIAASSHRLSSLVKSPTYHRALPDALSCMELFKKCIRILERKRDRTLIYLWEITE